MAAKSMEEIAVLIKGLRFRKKMIGGIDERDVWRKLDMLQKEYRAAFDAQQEQSRALINERDEKIMKLKERLSSKHISQGDANG